MNIENVPTNLIDELPSDIKLEDCIITTFGKLREREITYAFYPRPDIDNNAIVVILPGWNADDGNWEEHYQTDSGEEAAQEYADDGDWGEVNKTIWIKIDAWQTGYVLDDDEIVELVIDRESHRIEINPNEPDCEEDQDHDWQSPYSVLGGIKENPGVWGHGGGVIYREVCAHCGKYRVTDTWANDGGYQGLTSVSYEDADDLSLKWINECEEMIDE